jgi:hypothetical protein
MKLIKFIRLLALAHKPDDSKSILDWRPFASGDRLNEIISKHNTRCLESYEGWGWLPDRIEKLVEGIDVVPRDLSSVHELRIPDYADIRILLIDLDAIQDAVNLDQIKERICDHKQPFYVTQVSSKSKSNSLSAYFCKELGVPSHPDILPDQKAFEEWLYNFCLFYRTALLTISEIAPKLMAKEQYI